MRSRALLALILAGTCVAAADAGASEAKKGRAGRGGMVAVIDGPGGPVKAPLFSTRFASTPVAKVANQVITLQDFSLALAEAHQDREQTRRVHKPQFQGILDRLIGVRLILLEAEEIGIPELPEIKAALRAYQEKTLREVLKLELVKDVHPDPAEVERLYQEAVREWKLKSVVFDKEEDAKAMAASLKARKRFDELAGKAIAAKAARSADETQFLAARPLLPQVLEAVRSLKRGQTTGVVKLDPGFAILEVEDIRLHDDPKAKAEVEQSSLERRREAALRAHYEELLKRSVEIDRKVLDSLDFETQQPGFAALAKDARVLATIRGEKPVTVADLAQAIENTFFHGVEEAIRGKSVNEKKPWIFESLLYKRLLDSEAQRRRIADTAEFKRSVAEYRDGIVFGTFIEKVVRPAVKVSEEDGQKYYAEHKGYYTYPEFYSLVSLGFATSEAAQSAFDKLKAGTDFKWLQTNAQGQLPEAQRSLVFEGNTVSARSLDPALARTLAGARPGEYRLYRTGDGQHYLLFVKQALPARVQPYLEVREAIGKKLAVRKTNQLVEEWTRKLRKAYAVKVYLTRLES